MSADRPIQEFRAGKHGGHDLFDSLIESPAILASRIIERHQLRQLLRSCRPTESAPREILGDLFSASGFALRFGVTHKNQCAARRHGYSRRIVWADDFNAVNQTRHASPESALAARYVFAGLKSRALDESHYNIMYACLNLNRNLLETRHDLRATIRSFAIRESEIFGSTDRFLDNH